MSFFANSAAIVNMRSIFAEICEGSEALKSQRELALHGRTDHVAPVVDAARSGEAPVTEQPYESALEFERGNLVFRNIDF